MAAQSHHPTEPAPPPAAGIAEIFFEAGVHHLKTHRIPQAREAFEAALAANPAPGQQAAILYALGNAARRLGQSHSAENFLGRSLSLEPRRQEALADLSALYRNDGRYREAQILLEGALDADPASPELWLSLAQVLREIGDLERSHHFVAEALRLSPNHAPALGCMGELLTERGEHEAARQLYAHALRLAPFDARLRYHHALALLSSGVLAEGWQDFSHRFQAIGLPPAGHGIRAWNGAPIPGQTLLLLAELRLSDQLLFASVISDALRAARTDRVIIACAPPLVPLFARSFPAATVLSEMQGGADVALPIGDLPRLFRNRPEDFPACEAYLAPDPSECTRWQDALALLGPPPYIGLNWRAERQHGQRAERSAPLNAWAGFLSCLPGTPICVQPDATSEEIAALEEASGRPLARPAGLVQSREWDRSAALLAALDRVVSAPGARAALAAAVGTKTLKLISSGSWTGLGRDIEPLAPACHLITPDSPGDWNEVFARAARSI